ncbi:hypothetical protein A9Q75_19470 [Colwellia psychrerythraea]|uniref:Cytochrome c domain-containing protein n=1 Tax=Colwellia psychrerythraea TaxID=28229 RepID=A0A1Y5DWM5_COLPS|nr:hypothetical protein A9Q75_19470 [Colwellia psychrerythraea]
MAILKKTIFIFSLIALSCSYVNAKDILDKNTGFVIDTGFELVRANCTACHSSGLVIQNRMNRDTWLETIRWMQKTQGLWPLGDSEKAILDYLAKHYSPTATGRRKNLPAHLMPALLTQFN